MERGRMRKGDWREKGRQERRKKLRNEVKKGTPTLFYKVFLLYGARLSNAIKYDSLPHMSGRKNIHLLTTYLWFFASVHFPLFFFRSEPIDK